MKSIYHFDRFDCKFKNKQTKTEITLEDSALAQREHLLPELADESS